jgi:hypothetical protein
MLTYKFYLIWNVLLAILVNTSISYSQVGVNTTNPRKTLEVAGDMEISGSVDIGTYNPLSDTDTSSFLIQESDNSVKSLDVSNPTGIALAYVQEYIITNPDLDWIKDFDTGVDASDFTMIITSASFDLELDLTEVGPGLDEENSSLPFTATFIKSGTWHIIADYPQAANIDETEIGTWTISTLIFSSDVSKQFGNIPIPMLHGTTGSAAVPIIH